MAEILERNRVTPREFEVQWTLPPEDWPKIEFLVTEDDEPVDSIFAEKQQRLLTESLYASWPGPGDGRPFLALANVGLFYNINHPPFVPDAFLSLDVRLPEDIFSKGNRSYFTWKYGKAPEVVIEIVSDTVGGEDGRKLRGYAQIGVGYYVIFDPERYLSGEVLRVFALQANGIYQPLAEPYRFPLVGLGVTLWTGCYEGRSATWLRWVDASGRMIPTGAEQIAQEQVITAQERQRAEQERQRAERLAQRLRDLGIDLDPE
jgi:Uma2 family endonuclease